MKKYLEPILEFIPRNELEDIVTLSVGGDVDWDGDYERDFDDFFNM